MDNAKIKKYKDILMDRLHFLGDCSPSNEIQRSVLLVEGDTDKAFIEKILAYNVRCLAVREFVMAQDAFRTSSTSEQTNEREDCKAVITNILQRISLFPEIIDFPRGAQDWPLFGLVDNDYNTQDNYSRVKKLFFTDTHDIETLMLSTDPDLLTRLEECQISQEEFRIALFLAFQLAAFRQAIRSNGALHEYNIAEKDGTVDYSKFVNEYRICLADLAKHINSNMKDPLSNEKLKKERDKISADMKKQLDRDGVWKKGEDSFSADNNEQFWMDVNGHDVLSAIRYLNEDAMHAFSNSGGRRLNRQFEFKLPEVYDYERFKTTRLYGRLKEYELI